MKTSLKIEDDVIVAGVKDGPAGTIYRNNALTHIIMAVSSITLRAELGYGAVCFPEQLFNDKLMEFLCRGSQRFFEAIRLSDRAAFHIRYADNELVLRINVTKGKTPVYCVELKFRAENKFDDGNLKEVVYL